MNGNGQKHLMKSHSGDCPVSEMQSRPRGRLRMGRMLVGDGFAFRAAPFTVKGFEGVQGLAGNGPLLPHPVSLELIGPDVEQDARFRDPQFSRGFLWCAKVHISPPSIFYHNGNVST